MKDRDIHIGTNQSNYSHVLRKVSFPPSMFYSKPSFCSIQSPQSKPKDPEVHFFFLVKVMSLKWQEKELTQFLFSINFTNLQVSFSFSFL